MSLKSSISSHVRISYRFYQFVTTRYTTDFYIINGIYPEGVCLDILPAITPEANPIREDFPIEYDINVIKEEEAIITPHAPCMSDIIKELNTDIKEQNLTEDEYLQFANNYVLNYKVGKEQREEISLITVGQSSNSN